MLKKRKKNKPVGLDLFAGAGGLSLGFEQAGFSIAYAVERDVCAAETYKKNRIKINPTVDTRSIKIISPSSILKKLGLKKGELDIIIGGPPCQGFSTSNRQTRNSQNPDNHLVFSFMDFVKKIAPKWFVMENVAGMNTFEKGTLKDQLLIAFEALGYNCECVMLNSADFGVPQNRKRIFFIGNCVGNSMEFIDKLKKKQAAFPISVYDAISDLPKIENGNDIDTMSYNKRKRKLSSYQLEMRKSMNGIVSNNLATRHSEVAITRFSNIKQGENLIALARKMPHLVLNYSNIENCHHWIYLRLPWKSPSVTLNNYRKNMLIHPADDRGLSVREAARLQSFPDKYVFYGYLGSQQQQVANAVPPLLSKAIAKKIIQNLK